MSKFKDLWGKAKILLSQLLCIGAVFTACTDDEVFNQTTKALQVSVSTEAPAESRAIIDGGYLPNGASIGVTLTAEDGTAYDGQAFTNLQYTAAGEGSSQTWSSTTPASLSITAGKVIAYYPYYGGDDFDLKAVPVETASQTDYMYVKTVTGINMVSPSANLTMQHAMTDIRINVKKGTYTGTGEVTKITAKAPAFATSATMDVETGVFANVSGGGAQFVQELTGAAISSGNIVHDFLIVPDAKSTSGDVSIFVIIDGKKFAVTIPYTESFQQGFAYTYNLTLDNAALTLDGVSVAKWGVKAEVDESLQFYDDQYIVEIQVPSDNYTYRHNLSSYDVVIDWGDGSSSSLQNKSESINSYGLPSHKYEKAGTYQIKVEGKIKNINSQYASKIISKIIYIGKDCDITSMKYAFFSQGLLKTIPEGVFDKCTEVTTFESAFQDCDALTTIPEGLFDNNTKVTSFNSVFCKGGSNDDKMYIISIPEGLFDYNTEVTDFSHAFSRCESLTDIPGRLFDHNTKVTSFYGTFSECKKLQTIPEGLFDYNTEVTDFRSVFRDCESLTEIPSGLFDYNTKVTTFWYTFLDCSGIRSIPSGLFDNCPEVTDFEKTFQGCSKLQAIPVGLFDYNTKTLKFRYTFSYCSSLTAIPEGLFDKCTEVTDFSGTFNICSAIQNIPDGLFDYNTKVTNFQSTFYGVKITAIPEELFLYNTKVTNFGGTFAGCSSLTEIPENLFKYNTEVTDFAGTFSGCRSLSSIPENLFKYNTKVTSFGSAFANCKSLITIPEGMFQYNTNVTNFSWLFSSCVSLQTIPEGLFKNNVKVTQFESTFEKCSNLTTVPEGLFKYNTEVTTFSYVFAAYHNNEKISMKLNSIPAGLFDYNTKVTNFSYAFNQCDNLGGESPYTVIQVDGVDTKVHLYERENYPDNFVKPISNYSCFYKCTNLTDYNSIPSDWKSY